MNDIALGQEQFGQIRAVLPCYAGDKSGLRRSVKPFLNLTDGQISSYEKVPVSAVNVPWVADI